MPGDPQRQKAITIALAAAIVIAPFLALLFSIKAGLGLMTVALLATAFLIHEGTTTGPAAAHRQLRALLGANLILAALCVIALVYLLVNG